MLGAVLLTMGLHLFIIYMLFCNELFSTTPLTVAELGIAVAVVSVVFWVVEAQKLVSRRYAGPIQVVLPLVPVSVVSGYVG